MRLTNGDVVSGGVNGDHQTGAIVSNFTFPTNQGIQVTFSTVTYGGDGGTGADGISFFLSDGSKAPTVGGSGGSLGYSCSNTNSLYDGVIGAYLGIGIDEYGNFSDKSDNTDTGPGARSGRISLRGAGSTAFALLSSADSVYRMYYPEGLESTFRRPRARPSGPPRHRSAPRRRTNAERIRSISSARRRTRATR